MIAIKERELTTDSVQNVANEYIASALGPNYFTDQSTERDRGWNFIVQCRYEDINKCPPVGILAVFENGQVEQLSEDRIRDMRETGEIRAAKERGEKFARDKNGFVLRRQARIKASCWTSDNIGMKFGAEGGIFIDLDDPIWRFSVHFYFPEGDSPVLDVIDVDAKTGTVHPLSDEQIKAIAGGIRAARRIQEQTAEAVQ